MSLENQMQDLWKKYLETKNFNYLAEACEKAPFLVKKTWEKKLERF